MSAYNFTEEDVEGWFYSDWQSYTDELLCEIF